MENFQFAFQTTPAHLGQSQKKTAVTPELNQAHNWMNIDDEKLQDFSFDDLENHLTELTFFLLNLERHIQTKSSTSPFDQFRFVIKGTEYGMCMAGDDILISVEIDKRNNAGFQKGYLLQNHSFKTIFERMKLQAEQARQEYSVRLFG